MAESEEADARLTLWVEKQQYKQRHRQPQEHTKTEKKTVYQRFLIDWYVSEIFADAMWCNLRCVCPVFKQTTPAGTLETLRLICPMKKRTTVTPEEFHMLHVGLNWQAIDWFRIWIAVCEAVEESSCFKVQAFELRRLFLMDPWKQLKQRPWLP